MKFWLMFSKRKKKFLYNKQGKIMSDLIFKRNIKNIQNPLLKSFTQNIMFI